MIFDPLSEKLSLRFQGVSAWLFCEKSCFRGLDIHGEPNRLRFTDGLFGVCEFRSSLPCRRFVVWRFETELAFGMPLHPYSHALLPLPFLVPVPWSSALSSSNSAARLHFLGYHCFSLVAAKQTQILLLSPFSSLILTFPQDLRSANVYDNGGT